MIPSGSNVGRELHSFFFLTAFKFLSFEFQEADLSCPCRKKGQSLPLRIDSVSREKVWKRSRNFSVVCEWNARKGTKELVPRLVKGLGWGVLGLGVGQQRPQRLEFPCMVQIPGFLVAARGQQPGRHAVVSLHRVQ